MKKFIFSLASVLLMFSFEAGAQRLIPGQIAVDFGGTAWQPYGGEVGVNFIRYGGKMLARVNGLVLGNQNYGSWIETDPQTHEGQVDQIPVRYTDLYASWGYLWGLVHNRSRSVNLWGGITVDLGARLRGLRGETGFKPSRVPAAGFLYGCSPELNFEVFPTDFFSISVFARAHLQFVTRSRDFKEDDSENCFFPQFGVQFNFYFFPGK